MRRLITISILFLMAFAGFAQSVNFYEYNNLNQLVKTTYANGVVVQYQYDALGNRISKTVVGVNYTYSITATASPTAGGSVVGAGTYDSGSNCTLIATANSGYNFINWTENGIQVSSSASYSFTVTGDRTLVAHFEEIVPNSYVVTASANPNIGGIVNGSGTYLEGSSCTLNAIANTGYSFVNWTNNGTVVSTNPYFNFTVTGNQNYVANFVQITYNIIASANPTVGGSVDGAGTYPQGSNCTLIATANSGYNFVNWTENGTQVTTNANYSFTVTGNRTLVANFQEIQPNSYLITVAANPNEGGTVSGSGTYLEGVSCTLTAVPNAGYEFVNWTTGGTVVSTNSTYSFTVSQNASYVANFNSTIVNITQTTSLPSGWTWWSSYIEQSGINGLNQLETSLGNNGMMIKSQANGFVTNSGGMWFGSLSGINNNYTYLIQTNSFCQMSVTGVVATPAAHPISLPTGWTWVGYPCNASMSVTTALSGLSPVSNDQLKSQQGFAIYTPGVGWLGSLQTITPGMGLMFESHNSSTVTLTYASPSKSEELRENITTLQNHWRPVVSNYSDNMTMVAVVEMDGEELRGEHLELGAFANGECRGSAELMYVEALDRYMAFLTMYGDNTEELFFGLYDAKADEENYDSQESVIFAVNATEGNPIEPYVIGFRGMTGVDEFGGSVKVFPNPVEKGQSFTVSTSEYSGKVQIAIINALGVVEDVVSSQHKPVTVKAPSIPGVYLLRIMKEGQGTSYRRIVVK